MPSLRQQVEDRRLLGEAARVAEFERVNRQGASDAKAAAVGRQLIEEATRAQEHSKVTLGGIGIHSNRERAKEVKAFWGASKTPEAGPTPTAFQDRPRDYTVCPMSGKKLKLKDLIDLKFTRASKEEEE